MGGLALGSLEAFDDVFFCVVFKIDIEKDLQINVCLFQNLVSGTEFAWLRFPVVVFSLLCFDFVCLVRVVFT